MTPIEEMEQQLVNLRKISDLSDVEARLVSNPDFKRLIIEGFCRDAAAKYVHESMDPALDANQRADALALAQAGGHLLRFLESIRVMGNTAKNNIREYEIEMEEMRAEGDD